jgi:GNAT superfamily N-acetyltransferase
MPAMLDDPSSPPIYRTSGAAPFPDPHDVQPQLPIEIYPRQVTLRDRVTTATIVPFSSQHQVPPSLLAYLSDQLNKEIENGDTYPMIDTMPMDKFSSYWFQNFGAVMLLGNIESSNEVTEGKNWAIECLGSFYIKPNYPGRSSHVCNAGFLVTDAARNRGVGRLMGESYLDWAPKLGYTYSVFNLVYETNVASCRIWDALGFKRIGRVKGAGNLKSYPGQLVDAIIYGRDLGPEGEDFVSEERFDKIKFYLKFGKYPAGADRAEKSRLRSAATHYKLIPETDKLMLKDKEVISDPQRQYEIARNVHVLQHGGINKTTATIAEKYHWVRIKETVSLVIRNCTQCKELGKAPVVRGDGVIRPAPRAQPASPAGQGGVSAAGRVLSLHQEHSPQDWFSGHAGQGSVSPQVLNHPLPGQHSPGSNSHMQPRMHQVQIHHQQRRPAPIARMQDEFLPLDPQITEDVRNHLGGYNSHPHTLSPPSHSQIHHVQHQRSEFVSPSPEADDNHNHHDSDSFMLDTSHQHRHGDRDVNEDLDMLIDADHDEDRDGEDDVDVLENIRSPPIEDEDGDGAIIQLQAEAAARAAEEALRTVGREYGGD